MSESMQWHRTDVACPNCGRMSLASYDTSGLNCTRALVLDDVVRCAKCATHFQLKAHGLQWVDRRKIVIGNPLRVGLTRAQTWACMLGPAVILIVLAMLFG